MFKFLKRKLTTAVKNVTRKVEEEPSKEEGEGNVVSSEKVEIQDTPKESTTCPIELPGIEPKTPQEKIIEEKKQDLAKDALEEEIQEKGFLKKVTEKVTTKKISENKFEDLFQDLQIALLENNVALEVVDKIKADLKEELLNKALKRSEIEAEILKSLKNSISEILTPPEFNLLEQIKKTESPPYVILIIGYNGAGKSLTCARLGYYLKNKGFKPVLSAADSFRASGREQTQEYGKMAEIPVITDLNTQDSCSIIFDTIKHAKAKDYDVVIADTSGRIQNNQDLMGELKKISRVNNPDATILVVDSLTGSDVVSQAAEFDKNIAVDALILTKTDVDEKGGAFLSATYVAKKPVLYIGSGQNMQDFEEYNKEKILENMGL